MFENYMDTYTWNIHTPQDLWDFDKETQETVAQATVSRYYDGSPVFGDHVKGKEEFLQLLQERHDHGEEGGQLTVEGRVIYRNGKTARVEFSANANHKGVIPTITAAGLESRKTATHNRWVVETLEDVENFQEWSLHKATLDATYSVAAIYSLNTAYDLDEIVSRDLFQGQLAEECQSLSDPAHLSINPIRPMVVAVVDFSNGEPVGMEVALKPGERDLEDPNTLWVQGRHEEEDGKTYQYLHQISI